MGIFKIIQQFLLHEYSNTLTHSFLVMNDLSAADLFHADLCQTQKNVQAKDRVYINECMGKTFQAATTDT